VAWWLARLPFRLADCGAGSLVFTKHPLFANETAMAGIARLGPLE
jgi:hypothetical protein